MVLLALRLGVRLRYLAISVCCALLYYISVGVQNFHHTFELLSLFSKNGLGLTSAFFGIPPLYYDISGPYLVIPFLSFLTLLLLFFEVTTYSPSPP